MDLLEQYRQMNPQSGQAQNPLPAADVYGREYSGMTAFIIRLSGGRIRNARQASYLLLGVAAIVAVISGILFLRLFGIGTGPDTNKIIPIAGPGIESSR